ncbi:MAG: caspase family protein [Myxococcota bacterium]
MIPVWLLLWTAFASAADVRFGLFVGNNHGSTGDQPLVFAETDAQKMRDLFVRFGGMEPRHAVIVKGATTRGLLAELERLTIKALERTSDGDRVTFVVYYSGHGDNESLHLGTTKLSYDLLRDRIEQTGAQIRIVMVDACQSGALVRRKGGRRGPPMAFATPTAESMQGTAILTSSAASELSQESSEIGGGFFTHYLHTALSGGADLDRDGLVSLAETYAYVYAETAFRTRDAPETQTPHGDFDLSGAGDVVLTRLEAATARIAFLGDLEGAFSVWDESRRRYVAEVDGTQPLTLAVTPGSFFVHKRMPGYVEEAQVEVRRGETRTVIAEDFTVVSYEDAASRGDIDRQVRRSRIPDLSLRFIIGGRGFGNVNYASQYFAPHLVGGLQARFLSRNRSYWGFDVLSGRATTNWEFDGLPAVEALQTSTTALGVVGYATRPRLVRAGIGAQGGIVWLSREFPEFGVDRQTALGLGMGVNTWVGIHHGRFVGDLQFNINLMVTSWEDNEGWPAFSDTLLTLGYRF